MVVMQQEHCPKASVVKVKMGGTLLLSLFCAVLMVWMHPVKRKEPDQKQYTGRVYQNDCTEEEQKFTIIVQTYKRTKVPLQLQQLCQAVPYLQQIIVVWNNIGEEPPMELWNSLGPHLVPVTFKKQRSNQVANRFQLFPEIHNSRSVYAQTFLWRVCVCVYVP